MDDEGRRYCADRPDDIPHLVDSRQALRCDQHRAQRHRWSDANGYRRRTGRPLLDWVPEPLTPQRRREALYLNSEGNAKSIHRAVASIKKSIEVLEKDVRPRPESEVYKILVAQVAQIRAECSQLQEVAWRMGGN